MSTEKGVIVVINDSENERESHDANNTSTMNDTKDGPSNFEEEFNGWLEQLDREIESTRRSEQLTEKDYSIRINAKD